MRSGCATPDPDTSLSFAIMLDILLIVVIGGMGTMYGAIIGGTLFVLAQNYLQALMGAVSAAAGEAGMPILPQPVSPRPLAALARRAVHLVGLFLPDRHRRQAARTAAVAHKRSIKLRHARTCCGHPRLTFLVR